VRDGIARRSASVNDRLGDEAADSSFTEKPSSSGRVVGIGRPGNGAEFSEADIAAHFKATAR